MKRLQRWAVLITAFIVVIAVSAVVSLELFVKQKPFATADEYWAQMEEHKLTPDVIGQWNYALGTVDTLSHGQKKYFPLSGPYDMGMYKRWVDANKDNETALNYVYLSFSHDPDYGWPQEMQGVPWMWALIPYIWSAPSIAIIDKNRSAEAAWIVKESVDVLRSPAGWKNYAIDQGWGDPMWNNAQWKGPLLMGECLYTLMTGDKEVYGAEIQALAHEAYEAQRRNSALPMGKGYSGGLDCEENHWFVQCNSMVLMGLTLYDKIYGVDPVYGVKLGEEYNRTYMRFIKEDMTDPETGLVYRMWHPYGPMMADKDLSGYGNVFLAAVLKQYDPKFSNNIYDHIRVSYVRQAPLGLGAFILEVPEKDIRTQEIINPGADQPGMIGESALNIFLVLLAAREQNDSKTFDMVNELLTTLTRPYYRQGQLRFDETNEDPSGMEGFTEGQLLNMYSGWWMLGKVHVGWDVIMDHNWTENRDAKGMMINFPSELSRISSSPCCSR